MNVGTSQEAASDFWKFLQIFLADSRFSKYQKNDFAIWTESYGGHYGPTFAAYVHTSVGRPVNVLTDRIIQLPSRTECWYC